MASIQKRVSGDGKTISYRVRWREVKDGPQLTRSFRTKAAADSFRKQLDAALDAGTYVSPKTAETPFEDYYNAWKERQIWRPGTRARVERTVRLHILPVFGPRALNEITRADCETVLATWRTTYAEKTTALMFTTLRTILRAAVADDVLRRSPTDGIKLAKPSRVAPFRLPTTDEIFRIADAIRPEFRAMVFLGAGAGLRSGEALAITTDRIEWAPGAIRVEASLQTYPGGEIVEVEPKTKTSNRIVPVAADVLEELGRHLEAEAARTGAETSGYLFTIRDHPVSRTAWGEIWRNARSAAGLPDGMRFHDLRHYYASLLIASGLSVKAVQARLGHASATETLETYAHLWPNSDDETRTAIAGEWARAKAERAQIS